MPVCFNPAFLWCAVFAFVKFYLASEAAAARTALNSIKFRGQRIHVQNARRRRASLAVKQFDLASSDSSVSDMDSTVADSASTTEGLFDTMLPIQACINLANHLFGPTGWSCQIRELRVVAPADGGAAASSVSTAANLISGGTGTSVRVGATHSSKVASSSSSSSSRSASLRSVAAAAPSKRSCRCDSSFDSLNYALRKFTISPALHPSL